jgi:dihydrofolate synthase/folylpolyglutamate synthase
VRQGVAIPGASLRRGLAEVVWPGRLELLAPAAGGAAPVVALDSAHNDESAGLLAAALAHYFPQRPLHLVIGVSNDKDAAGILAELLPGAEAVILTRSRHPRAADPAELAALARRYLPASRVSVVETLPAALAHSLAAAEANAVICLTGSLFVAGEGREAWLALHPGGLPAGDWAYEAEPPAPDWQVSQTKEPAP